MKTGILGSSTFFQKVGKGVATTKSRHGVVTPMNQVHTAVECTLSDFYAPDYADKLDEAKTNIDERMAIARGGAWALGRKVDDQIITALGTTTQTAVSWTVSSQNAIRNSLIAMSEAMDVLDVPNDGRRCALISPRQWSFAMTVKEFASSDWVGANGQPYNEGAPLGRWKSFMNMNWMAHTGVSGSATASSVPLAWHPDAIGYATGAFAGNSADNDMVSAEINYVPERVAHLINHMMSGGAVLIDDTGVIKGACDDTQAVPTS